MDSIGERLREEREALGYTQGDFADLVGQSRKSQGRYEAGERAPDAEYLSTAAKHGVDVLYVLTGQRTPGLDTVRAVHGQMGSKVIELGRVARDIEQLEREALPGVSRDDLDRWQRAIALVERGLDEADLTMEPAVKARLIVVAYDLLADDSAASRARIIELAKVRRR